MNNETLLEQILTYTGSNSYVITLQSKLINGETLNSTQLLLAKKFVTTHAIESDDKTLLPKPLLKTFPIKWDKYAHRMPFDFQQEGIQFLMNKERAILADEMGTGKSIQSIIAALELGIKKILIVCPNTLKFNWKKEFEFYTNASITIIDKEWELDTISIINYDKLAKFSKQIEKSKFELVVADEAHYLKGASKRFKTFCKISNRAQRLWLLTGTPIANRPIDFYNLLKLCKHELGKRKTDFVPAFCLRGDAPILLSDLTTKPISELQIGEEIYGWAKPEKSVGVNYRLTKAKILNVLKKQSKLLECKLSNGSTIYCTPDHLWYNHRSKTLYKPISTKSNLSYVYSGFNTFEKTKDYQFAYLIGALRGDGHISRQYFYRTHPFKNTTQTKPYINKQEIFFSSNDQCIIDRICEYLNNFNIHYTLSKYKKCTKINVVNNDWNLTWEFFQQEFSKTSDGYKGFLAGIYDAEGGQSSIFQSEVMNLSTCDLIRESLTALKISYTQTISTKSKNNKNEVISFNILSGRKGLLNFFNLVNPSCSRKLQKIFTSHGSKFVTEQVFVNSIIELPGEHDVYTLTTETGNYIAYGLCSKNCGGGQTYWGYQTDGASNLKELHYKTQDVILRRTKAQVLTLPPKTRQPVYLGLSNMKGYNNAVQKYYEQKFTLDLESNDLYDLSIAENFLVELSILRQFTALEKISDGSTTDLIDSCLDANKKVIVYTNYRAVVDTLCELYKDQILFIDGRVSPEDRQKNVDLFQNNPKYKVIVCNYKAASTGITLTAADTMIMNDLDWSPANVGQAEDRFYRIGQDKSVTVLYPLYQDTIEDMMFSMFISKFQDISLAVDGIQTAPFDKKELYKLLKNKKA